MLGFFRTFLALLVVVQHLGGASVLGAYAVFGFYCISGYLMTTVINESYGHSAKGIGRYLLNRFLRIYPLYWLSALLSIILVLTFSTSATRAFHPDIFLPQNFSDTLRNIFIFFPQLESPRLTPPAWALTVELFFYLVIGFGLSKNKTITSVWFLASVGYHLLAAVMSFGWDRIYFTIPAASLPFSTGAMIYHHREFLRRSVTRLPSFSFVPGFLFAVIILNWWFASRGGYVRDIGFYINYLLCTITIISLTSGHFSAFIARDLDKKIGDLSYPIYLFHYQIGFLVLFVLNCLDIGAARGSSLLVVASIPVIVVIAWAITRWIESPIMTIRARIKAGQ